MWYYPVLFLGYCIAAALLLPIPVEAALTTDFVVLPIVMGGGKAVAAFMVFHIGISVDSEMRRWLRYKWMVEALNWLEDQCRRFGYLMIYAILAIPLLPDTIPLYLFGIVNRGGTIYDRKWFVVTNFFAGWTRGLIVGILWFAGVWAM